MGTKWWWLWISWRRSRSSLSIISLAVSGLNLGIDFKGGTQTTFTTPAHVAPASARPGRAVGQKGAVVQGQGKLFGSDSYKEFQVRTKSLTAGQQAKFLNDLRTRLEREHPRVDERLFELRPRRSPRDAILAIIVSLR